MSNTSSLSIVNKSREGKLPYDFKFKHVDFDIEAEKIELAEILGLPSTDGWIITDAYKDLRLVHYLDDADMSAYGHLRGTAVSLNGKCIVASSFGYTPVAVADTLSAKDGMLNIVDKDGTMHNYQLDNVKIKRAFECVILRTIWYDGEMIKLSHRKFNPVKSHWGESPYFDELYTLAGGPSAEQQFDLSKQYSSTCNIWSLVDKSLLVASRQRVTSPYLVYLGSNEMHLSFPEQDVSPAHNSFETSDTITGSVEETFTHNPQLLSLEEANHHLQWGYYTEYPLEDRRQGTGESLIVYEIKDGESVNILKVNSTSFDWRLTIRGNNPNINHQFYSLLNTVYPNIHNSEAWDILNKKYIVFPLYDPLSMKQFYEQNGYILTIPQALVNKSDYNSRDQRIHLLWMNFVLSLPPHLQGKGLDLLYNFNKDRNDLIKWLQHFERNNKDISNLEEFSDRIKGEKGIINQSRIFAKRAFSAGTNYARTGKFIPLNKLIANNIRNLVYKENGTSLYSLVREMKRFEKLKAEQLQAQQLQSEQLQSQNEAVVPETTN